MPVSSFAPDLGQLLIVRCLGTQQHGSLCAYNGYDKSAPVTSAAQRRQLAGGRMGAAAAVAAALASAWLAI
jgi:hypothetical protein